MPNATAVAINLTAVNATATTFLTVRPRRRHHPPKPPTTSTLNLNNAGAVANFVIVALQPDGAIDVWNSAGNVNALADVAGYIQ